MADEKNGQPTTVVEEVGEEKPKSKRGKSKKAKKTAAPSSRRGALGRVAYPKDSLLASLRIPQAIIDQNAGGACTDREGVAFTHVGWTGGVRVEISSALKYGLLERPSQGKIKPTELARRIIRPQDPKDRMAGLRQAVLNAPVISDVYTKYRGENLPDTEFLVNTLVDSFNVPREQIDEFIAVFVQTLKDAELLEELSSGKYRVLDVT